MKKVLVVDPSKSFGHFAKVVLTRLGYDVLHVPDGETALYILPGHAPDLILTETALPGISGVELGRRVRKSPMGESIPLAAVARVGSEAVRNAALGAGFCAFLPKPVDARGLHQLMQEHLPFSPRRRSLRARMALNATVMRGVTKETVKTSSIGEAGLYLEMARPIEEGTRLVVALPLPRLKSPVAFRGVVAYSLPEGRGSLAPGVGVRFTDVDTNTSTLFTHYMESYVSGFIR